MNETIAIIFLITVLLIFLAIVISTMIHQAKRERWIWFSLTYVIPPVMLLCYWVAWIVFPDFRGGE